VPHERWATTSRAKAASFTVSDALDKIMAANPNK
jgi:hypothetical protein